jgi:hypothetical protein
MLLIALIPSHSLDIFLVEKKKKEINYELSKLRQRRNIISIVLKSFEGATNFECKER